MRDVTPGEKETPNLESVVENMAPERKRMPSFGQRWKHAFTTVLTKDPNPWGIKVLYDPPNAIVE